MSRGVSQVWDVAYVQRAFFVRCPARLTTEGCPDRKRGVGLPLKCTRLGTCSHPNGTWYLRKFVQGALAQNPAVGSKESSSRFHATTKGHILAIDERTQGDQPRRGSGSGYNQLEYEAQRVLF